MAADTAGGEQRRLASDCELQTPDGSASATGRTKYIACADEGQRVHKEARVVVNNVSVNGIKGQYTAHRHNKAWCMSSF